MYKVPLDLILLYHNQLTVFCTEIYEFLEVPSHTNTFNNIENACGEQKDDQWGLLGLHDIRPNLSKISQNPIDVIGEENVKIYSKFDL